MLRRTLNQLRPEFWLPLPLIAVGFWFGSNWLNQKVMGQIYEPTKPLSARTLPQISLSLSGTVASIDAEIDHDAGTTEVDVQIIGGPLKELDFEYPLIEFAAIEEAIVQELELSPEFVRSMIRYRIDY